MDFFAEYERSRQWIEERLNTFFTSEVSQRGLMDAMRYSLLAGGKRIRPILTLRFCEAAGGHITPATLDFGCAVEMLHTYSLIHDDLPCMDDDDLRRGRPTCHKAYGECTATLAGDALQAAAFSAIAHADAPAERRAMAALSLADAVGPYGMCGGQYLDMDGEDRPLTVDDLKEIHALKTGALLKAACLLGLAAAGADAAQQCAAERYADALGLAFQVRDDILDATSTTEVLGKRVGSDAANHKCTFVSLLGLDACQRLVEEKTEEAKAAVREAFPNAEFLCALCGHLAQRET